MGSLVVLSASMAALLPTALGQAFFVQYSPGGDDTSVQRIDPIVNPGTLSEHVHQLFGASGLADTLTYEGLQSSSCSTLGSADGRENSQDKSIYWVPSLYMQGNDGGLVRLQTNGHKTYYIDVGEGEKVEPFEFPQGFQMIAGSPTNRGPLSNDAVSWTCYSGSANEGANGGFPEDVSTCESYPYLNAEIEFPHCWNGNDFDVNDPSAHVSYPEGGVARGGNCPSSHPKRLPHLFIETFFTLDSSVAAKVKPNSFVSSNGDNTGYGFHADFINGWDVGAIPALLDSCPDMNEDIGKCPNFKGGAPTSACKLPTQFEENVDSPGPNLPGCNPISTTNPAPKYQVAALGVSTDQCEVATSSSSTTDAAAAPIEDNGGTVVSPAPIANDFAAAPAANMVTATINGEVVSWVNPSKRTPAASPFDGSAAKKDFLRRRRARAHAHVHGGS